MAVETNIHWEVTDTYAGEANYSWGKRGKIEMKDKEFSNLSAIRKVKKEIGWNGVRCKTYDFGDFIEIRPYGVCQVCFITFHYFGSAS